MMIPWKEGGRGEGEEKKGIYIYIIYKVDPSCLQVLFP